MTSSTWEGLVEDLVPLNTQLVTPALAEAFDFPSQKTAVPSLRTGQNLGQQAPAQTASMAYSYQRPGFAARPSRGAAQQPLLANFYPPPAQPVLGPRQPGNFPLDGQAQLGSQQMQGLTQQLQGLGVPAVQPTLFQIKPEDKLGQQQGFVNAGTHFPEWLEGTAVPAGQLPAHPPATKPQLEANVGSDPENNDDLQARALKRPRLVWTSQLHQRFVDAVRQLGLKNAVPKTIMQLMNVDGLTRENVASHLQKYRLQLRKEEEGKGEELDKEDDGEDLVTGDTEVPLS